LHYLADRASNWQSSFQNESRDRGGRDYFVSEKNIANSGGVVFRLQSLDHAKPANRPRLLSDNGSSYIAGDLAKWLNDRNIKHLRGAPYHPMTQGKIELWHQTLKNRILLENYFLPGDFEAQIAAFIDDTTTVDTTRASTISPQQTSIAGAVRLSWPNDKGSNDRPLPTVDCSTTCRPPDITTSMRQSLP
jgi:hypothetical protein